MAAFQSEDEPRSKTATVIGGDLDSLSIHELERRVAELETEIERLKAVKARKQTERDAAQFLFKI